MEAGPGTTPVTVGWFTLQQTPTSRWPDSRRSQTIVFELEQRGWGAVPAAPTQAATAGDGRSGRFLADGTPCAIYAVMISCDLRSETR